MKRNIAITLFFLFLSVVASVVLSQAQAPQIPPNIELIMEKMEQGKQPTPEEQKALSDWGQSMSKVYGQGRIPDGKAAADTKKEELVLSVTMKVQSQASYNYNGVERPPGIGTSDIRLQATDGLSLEYTGETRFRVTWGTMEGKEFPFLETVSSRSSFTNSGSGSKYFKQTYNPKYGGSPCSILEEATWTRETPPEAKRVSRGPDAQFKDKETIIVSPFTAVCENVMKGKAFTRDECTHPNRPFENHPNVESIGHPGTKCDQLLHAAFDSADFKKNLEGKVDWNKPGLASGSAWYNMDVTDWVEQPARYSPQNYAFPKRGVVTLSWSLTRETPDPSEVTVEVAQYENWVPEGNIDDPKEPGKIPLMIMATVHKKGDKKTLRKAYLNISLPYVSKNKGVCGNWPKNAGEKEGLRFREKDFPASGGLLYKDWTHLETDVPVPSAAFSVYSYDYGAWGTLRITARDEAGRDLKVKIRGKETPDLDIPQDDDANRIADSWKPSETKGKPKDLDDETIEGQDAKGDGITLYDEYRGFVVLNAKGGREFVRLSSKTKEMFIIDKDSIAPVAKWEKVTGGFKAYRLNDTMVEFGEDERSGDKVNFNAPEPEAHPLLATTIISVKDNPLHGNPSPGWTDDHNIYIVPARIQLRIEEDFSWLDTAILKPDSVEGRGLRDEGPAMQISYADAYKAWTLLVDPNLRQIVSAKMQTVIVLHEMGHAFGLYGVDHGAIKNINGKDVPDPTPQGQEELSRSCMMFNQGMWGRRRTLIYTALGGGDKELAYPYRNFCRDVNDPRYKCFKSLKVKEW